ncbi:MAG: DUF4416 family protein [Lentisphaeria bacterium]|nr:DUF4416 family protein [Candidatus Neomarinimicrobiota bacterium]MCF7843198.1 DUF4416 family protein [Lentisphaeria bacterium]
MATTNALLTVARDLLTEKWGVVEFSTEIFPVDEITQYYRPEMGTGLVKQFLSFENLQSVADMNQSKFRTAQLEDEYRQDGKRSINLDPGYLTLDKLVLYTTKNFTHRIFIERGVFAEITLTYTRSGWRTHSWTYPDYQTDAALAFFTRVRQSLYYALQAGGELPSFSINSAQSDPKGDLS